jgi:hypothetical protein
LACCLWLAFKAPCCLFRRVQWASTLANKSIFAKNGKFSYDLGFLLPIDRSSQKWAYRLCGNVDSAHQRKPLFVKDASVEIFDDPISALDPMQSPLPLSKGQLSPITDAVGRAINACKHYNKPHHFHAPCQQTSDLTHTHRALPRNEPLPCPSKQ